MKIEKKRIARNIHRGLHDGGVPQNKYEECLRWAFGANYKSVQIRQWWCYWNKRHETKFKRDIKIYLMLKSIGEQWTLTT